MGLSVHWGPSSLGGKEIGWSRHAHIPKEEYDSFYKKFNPIKFDADEWCRLMSAEELIDDAIRVLGNNGNYMINLGPQPDGSFDKGQIALMDQLGAWLLEHEDAIYATRAAQYL